MNLNESCSPPVARQPPLSEKGYKRLNKVVYADPYLCDKSEFMNGLMQRCVAWILLNKGVHTVDTVCLEHGADWLSTKIEQYGRLAKVYARLRGSGTVNYVDMKQAIQEETKDEYLQIFQSVDLPVIGVSPKLVPKIVPPLYPIVAAEPPWGSHTSVPVEGSHSGTRMVATAAQQGSHSLNCPPAANGLSSMPHQDRVDHYKAKLARPACIPSFMPMFPPEYLYRKTTKLWITEEDRSVNEQLLFQKMELQMQLPQLQKSNIPSQLLPHGELSIGEDKEALWGAIVSQTSQMGQLMDGDVPDGEKGILPLKRPCTDTTTFEEVESTAHGDTVDVYQLTQGTSSASVLGSKEATSHLSAVAMAASQVVKGERFLHTPLESTSGQPLQSANKRHLNLYLQGSSVS